MYLGTRVALSFYGENGGSFEAFSIKSKKHNSSFCGRGWGRCSRAKKK
jgi:hypothetical protein